MLIECWELRAKVLPNTAGVPSVSLPEVKLLCQWVSAAPLHRRSFSWVSVYFIPTLLLELGVARGCLLLGSPEEPSGWASVPAGNGECTRKDPAADTGC